jgi:hypothetical protein
LLISKESKRISDNICRLIINDDSPIIEAVKRFKENTTLVIINRIKRSLSPPKSPPNKLFNRPR